MFLPLIVIAWLYVVVMMAVAEATNSNGTVLGAIFTFLLYGLGPVALLVYLLSTPARRRRLKEREARARELQQGSAQDAASITRSAPSAQAGTSESNAPNDDRETPRASVAPVRKEP